ncbi:sensor domain-containing diguanylate cyclase [Undibacterium sp. Di24W]|uniref:sensor domain-containing diguanylate cyclase n=1 Tax=Undibacterium sp. Di24W TaxID=3413033 RepID=UPI003BEFFC6D
MARLLSSLRIRLTLLFGALALLIGIAVSLYISYFVSLRMTETKAESVQKLAQAIAISISENLRERQREVGLLAQSPLLMQAPLNSNEIRKNLNRTKNTYRHYAWVGVADAQGLVQASSDGLLEGENVIARTWFIFGSKTSFFGDVHEAALLSKYLSTSQATSANQEPLRFVDFAAPVFDEQGKVRGVLAAHVHWRWVDEIIQRHLPEGAKANGIEVFLTNKNNEVLAPFSAIGKITVPPAMTNQAYQMSNWPDQNAYLASRTTINLYGESQQLWHVLVRQPVGQALKNVSELRQKMWLLGLIATVVVMLLAYWLSRAISAPIEQLSVIAKRIADGDEHAELQVHSSTHELKMLIASLHAMTSKLIERKRELLNFNDQLEQKVEERTFALKKSNLERESLSQQLELLARQDALTGLGNRMSANEHLQQEHLRMLRTENIYCVLLMDIDYFKKVNDSFGHAIGDQVLRQIADLLKMAVRTSDLVARYGGEEFIGVLPQTDLTGATILAEKITKLVEAHAMPGGAQVTLSVAVALSRVDDKDYDEVVKRADRALYAAKENGRNQVVVAPN